MDKRFADYKTAPSRNELLLLTAATAAIFISICSMQGYGRLITNFGDSSAYISIASAIRDWDFGRVEIKQSWGYPYAMALISLLTGISVQKSLLLVSVVSSIVSVVLACRLWGGWIAGFFAVLNFDWMQRSFLGGAEPLAVALIFGAFLAFRNERYVTAALFAALSTVVRPLGILCLLAIGVVLMYRRQYKNFLLAFLVGSAVGAAYMIPLATHFGDPLATVHSYEGGQYWLFGLPFLAIIKGTLLYPAPWTNLILSYGWILLVLIGMAMMMSSHNFREHANRNPVEVLFAVPYLLIVFCYNYPVFARGNFARFAIPALPLVFLALSKYLPRDRRILWVLGTLMPALAAASALGIRHTIHALMR